MEQNVFPMLRQMAGGYILSRCLHMIAELGVADVLGENPLSAAEIAASVGAHSDALNRVLRLLAAHGVFAVQGDTYVHSPASRLLREDHPQSMRAMVRNVGASINWAAYEAMEYSIRTGLPAGDKVAPGGFWAYRAERPELSRVFNQAMEARARTQIAGVMAAYDFSGFDRIGDIGGGHGHLLRAVLERVPTATGILFDQPHVIEEVKDLASERIILQAGDFFKEVLPVCDAYLLMEIIHDWGDSEALAILKAVHRSAPAHARILLVERMIPDDPGPDWAKNLDIHMMVLFGGKQRTRKEYEALFDQAGLSLMREIDTDGGVSILEGVPKNNGQQVRSKNAVNVSKTNQVADLTASGG